MFSNWFLVVNIVVRANQTQTDTTLTLTYRAVYRKAFGCIARCITHYYCLIFTTLYFDVFPHSIALFLCLVLRACILACVGSLFCACDHESNVHCHKNTFNSFPTCCTLILLSISHIHLIEKCAFTVCTATILDSIHL